MKNQIWLLLAMLAATGMWCYVAQILLPFERSQAIVSGTPGDLLGDLYPRWFGARELLLHGRDPYSTDVTKQIQTAFYGRALRPDEGKDQVRFAYPLYICFLLVPGLWSSFSTVQVCVSVLLAISTALSVLLWIRFLQWKISWSLTLALVLFVLSTPQVIQGLRLQQPGLLVGFLIAASFVLAQQRRLYIAGSLLALATIKPQMALLPVAWWLLWSASCWLERKRLLWGFAVTLALLVAGGELVLPGWISRFRAAATAYRLYAPGAVSLLEFLVGARAGIVLGVVLLMGLGVLCWLTRQEPANSPRFIVTFSLVLLAATLVMPIRALFNQILLLPGLFLVLRSWSTLWRAGWQTRATCIVLALVIGWPWLTAFYVLLVPNRLVTLPLLASFVMSLIVAVLLLRPARELLRS